MNRLTRLVPLTGLMFAVLFVISTAVGPTEPNAKASGAHVISFFTAHRNGERAGAVIGTLSVAFLIFFAGYLYDRIRHTDSRALGIVALVGAGLAAAGLLVGGSIAWTLTDDPAHYTATSAQTLNALGYDTFLPIIGGLMVFAISTGIAVLRAGWLPSWLGWVMIAFGVIAASPAFPLGLFGVVGWSAVVSVMLVTRARRSAAARPSLGSAAA